LENATQRFIQRFQHMEKTLAPSGRKLEDCNLDELDKLWEEAKIALS
jgi:ATP diphosphatase